MFLSNSLQPETSRWAYNLSSSNTLSGYYWREGFCLWTSIFTLSKQFISNSILLRWWSGKNLILHCAGEILSLVKLRKLPLWDGKWIWKQSLNSSRNPPHSVMVCSSTGQFILEVTEESGLYTGCQLSTREDFILLQVYKSDQEHAADSGADHTVEKWSKANIIMQQLCKPKRKQAKQDDSYRQSSLLSIIMMQLLF